jgi:hypothetical protein
MTCKKKFFWTRQLTSAPQQRKRRENKNKKTIFTILHDHVFFPRVVEREKDRKIKEEESVHYDGWVSIHALQLRSYNIGNNAISASAELWL